MSEYLNGYSEECVAYLPMLGRPILFYPRFRDCFLSEDKKRIIILTRCGGANRKQGLGENALYSDPCFVKTYDDEYDSTYGYYEFTPKPQFVADFNRMTEQGYKSASKVYIEYVKWFYKAFPPEIDEADIDKLFKGV